MTSIRQIKLELFNIRKAFTTFHVGWKYLYTKYILAPKIARLQKPLERPITHDNLSMHVLFGHQHVYMALWALASYYTISQCIGQLYIHSDRTLTDRDSTLLKAFFPSAVFVDPDTLCETHAEKFHHYPGVKAFREKHGHNFFVTKLIDPYFASDKENLMFFDIDILWFKNADLIQQQVEAGCTSSWMMDAGRTDESGKTNTVIFKDGSVLDPTYSRYNGGIMLFNKNNFNLERMTDYFERIDMTTPESKHWVEQSGYAYNLDYLQPLPLDTYIIKGAVQGNTIVKHYTGPRRIEFFAKGIPAISQLLDAS